MLSLTVDYLMDLYCAGRLISTKKGPCNDCIHTFSNGKEEDTTTCSPEEEY